jgi:hypothetical protein
MTQREISPMGEFLMTQTGAFKNSPSLLDYKKNLFWKLKILPLVKSLIKSFVKSTINVLIVLQSVYQNKSTKTYSIFP